MSNKLLIIGISGVTCGGKTTLAMTLSKLLPNVTVISQDDYFLKESDPRHTWIPELKHVNYDIISSLDMEKMYLDVLEVTKGKDTYLLKEGQTVELGLFSTQEDIQKYLYLQAKRSSINILLIEGFCIYNYKPLVPLFHLKYYFLLDEEECKRRRLTRIYEPPDCPGYFEKCVWPEHIKQLEEVRKTVRDVMYFNGQDKDVLDHIIVDIIKFIPE